MQNQAVSHGRIPKESMKYRPEIDGLRAVALIPVILFHAGFKPFSGGFVGVDVFFVISGFLITSILIRELEDESFSLLGFYERRARRILPILLFVTFCCIPVAWYMMLPAEYQDFSRSLVALSVFASNVLFYLEDGYFSLSAEDKPLLHTWSLAVEEQYYLFFPVFLWLMWRFRKRNVVVVIGLIAIVSFVLSEAITQKFSSFQDASFYLLPTRAWELLAGAVSAFIMYRYSVRPNAIIGVVGLLAILTAVFLFSHDTPFPGTYALLPVAGTVAVILFSEREGWVHGLLSSKVLVGVGLISYSAYLWHQPLFAFARVGSVGPPSVLLMSFLILLTFVLAAISWRLIETPFRNRNFIRRSRVFMLFGFLLLSTLVVGLVGNTPRIFNQAGAGHVTNFDIGNFDFNNSGLQDESWDYIGKIANDPDYFVEYNWSDKELWFKPDVDKQNVLVVGNSHAKDMFNVLDNAEKLKEKYQFARYGIQFYELVKGNGFFDSPNMREADIVVLATKFNREDMANTRNALELLKATGKRIILVKNIFEFEESRPKKINLIDNILHREMKQGHTEVESLSELINSEYFEHVRKGRTSDEVKGYNTEIDLIAKEMPDLEILDRMDYICDSATQSCDAVSENLDKYFFDYGHHTVTGARYFGSKIDEMGWFPVD